MASDPNCEEQMLAALQHLGSAIELLDLARAPAQIAAHVDLAVHQLRSAILAVAHRHLGHTDAKAELH